MPNKQEREVLDEIRHWQTEGFNTGLMAGVVNTAFAPLESLVDLAVPDSFIEKAVGPMRKVLNNLRDSSLRFVNPECIINKARVAGLPVEDLADFAHIPIAYLDILAKSLFAKNALYAALQGVGLGLGGYALAFVDLPVLFALNLKLILQIGTCYGYRPESKREKEFALRIFCIVSAAQGERNKELKKMDALIASSIKGSCPEALSILATEKATRGFINKLLRWLIKKKVTRGIPVVGAILGSGFNYFFTKEVAIYAYMFYRKRFLKEGFIKDGCSR